MRRYSPSRSRSRSPRPREYASDSHHHHEPAPEFSYRLPATTTQRPTDAASEKRVQKVQRRAQKLLSSGKLRVVVRKGLRYGAATAPQRQGARPKALCIINSETRSHLGLEGLRSKLISLGHATHGHDPREMFERLSSRGTFSRDQFVESVRSCGSGVLLPLDGRPRETRSQPTMHISDRDLHELFDTLDDGTGRVSAGALTAFVWGGGAHSSHDTSSHWQYPLPFAGRWDVEPRSLRLETSSAAGASLVIERVPQRRGVAACCANPDAAALHDAPSEPVRVALFDVRALVFGPAQAGEAGWCCVSVLTESSRWDFACEDGRTARQCFIALHSALRSAGRMTGGSGGERLLGRALWHAARLRLQALAVSTGASPMGALAQILRCPRCPRGFGASLRHPLARASYTTLAAKHAIKPKDGAAADITWVDGAGFEAADLTGARVELAGHGRGRVVALSKEATRGSLLHTVTMEEGREVLTLSLAPAPHGVDFMVEVARVRPPRPPQRGTAPRRSPTRWRPRASEQRTTATLDETTAWSPPVRRGSRERGDEGREEGADVWSI